MGGCEVEIILGWLRNFISLLLFFLFKSRTGKLETRRKVVRRSKPQFLLLLKSNSLLERTRLYISMLFVTFRYTKEKVNHKRIALTDF